MEEQAQEHFRALKQAVVARLQERHAGIPAHPQQWTGTDFLLWQEDLAAQVQGRVSEKWFYTHFKQEQDRLPRIDMLNLLSRYVGQDNWRAFVATQTVASGEVAPSKGESSRAFPVRYWAWALLLLPVWGFWQWRVSATGPTFCFVDALTNLPVADSSLEVRWLRQGESPVLLSVDAQGCVALPEDVERLSLAVQAPYYRNDTLHRVINPDRASAEIIPLRSDEYARMIHYFSQNQVADWQRRRAQLAEVFAEEARIFQLQAQDLRGMELYNKQEFIDQLTSPLSQLGQIDVLETRYANGKIVRLTFMQKE